MPAQVITTDDLLLFKTDLINEIKKILTTQPKQRKWLRSKDVREMLNISPGTLCTLRTNGTLPFTTVGKTVFYEYEDVVKIMNQNKHEAYK
ncbi:MAG TPA: helix-turn-helix domain-containing protein [Chitinophagales bacterium]|nr:helix-turn-helix domain-containing protein [Chitinophagales bacterium]